MFVSHPRFIFTMALALSPLPESASAQQQPYALSPRPGDSLSYPRPADAGMAEPLSVESCAWDTLALPYLYARGDVTYRVAADGVPDTATVTVQSVQGTDTRTFRAGAQKMVVGCWFRGRGEVPDSLTTVRQSLLFGAAGISAVLPDSFVARDPDQPVVMLSCPQPGTDVPGRVIVQLIVGTDGRTEPGSIRAINATSPEVERVALSLVLDCRFKAACFKGRAVRSLIELPINFLHK